MSAFIETYAVYEASKFRCYVKAGSDADAQTWAEEQIGRAADTRPSRSWTGTHNGYDTSAARVVGEAATR